MFRLKQYIIRSIITKYINKNKKHWNLTKGNEIFIGVNDKGEVDLWIVTLDEAWTHLGKI